MSLERSLIAAEPEGFARQDQTGSAGDVAPKAAQRRSQGRIVRKHHYDRADYRWQPCEPGRAQSWEMPEAHHE
jgi:hypothetical protein